MTDESSRTSPSLKHKSIFPIHVLRGHDKLNRPCYWFVMCPHDRLERMLKQLGTASVDISQIGIVVASGMGTTLSDAVRKKLKSNYDCDADMLFNAATPIANG